MPATPAPGYAGAFPGARNRVTPASNYSAREAGAPPTTKQGKPAVVGEGGDPTQFHAAVVAASDLAVYVDRALENQMSKINDVYSIFGLKMMYTAFWDPKLCIHRF